MVTDVVTMPSWATVREASNLFLAHRFLAFPVVDANRVLHGIADVSLFTRELADLANRQNADNAFQLIGIHLVADAGPWAGFKDRFPWLLANVGGGLLAAFVTSRYEALLDAVVVLALFIPVVLALAESVSIQSVTLTLQSLRGPRRSLIPEARPLSKEFATAVLLGHRMRRPRRPGRRRLARQCDARPDDPDRDCAIDGHRLHPRVSSCRRSSMRYAATRVSPPARSCWPSPTYARCSSTSILPDGCCELTRSKVLLVPRVLKVLRVRGSSGVCRFYGVRPSPDLKVGPTWRRDLVSRVGTMSKFGRNHANAPVAPVEPAEPEEHAP